jgi:hypothetical protein
MAVEITGEYAFQGPFTGRLRLDYAAESETVLWDVDEEYPVTWTYDENTNTFTLSAQSIYLESLWNLSLTGTALTQNCHRNRRCVDRRKDSRWRRRPRQDSAYNFVDRGFGAVVGRPSHRYNSIG